jgi:hypothetical protein
MSGKSRALTVAAATAGLIGLWAPMALAGTTHAPPGDHRSLVNGGLVNVNLGSDDTAVGNTCNNTNESAPLRGDILAWALDVSHNACAMAGGPSHF